MKRVLLLGCLALGSMSFVGVENNQVVEGDVDCFERANQVVEYLSENAYYIGEGGLEAAWDNVFYGCSEENGQLLDPVIIN